MNFRSFRLLNREPRATFCEDKLSRRWVAIANWSFCAFSQENRDLKANILKASYWGFNASPSTTTGAIS